MGPRFVNLLRCPKSGSTLRLVAEEGGFECPIPDSISRFVGSEHHPGSFGYEWLEWSRVQFETENIGKRMAGHTKRMFEQITGFSDGDLRGKYVVEFGCGPASYSGVKGTRA